MKENIANQIQSLVKLDFNNQRVLTTKQLSEVYETEENNIKKNLSVNKERFIEGKHYYLLKGEELKEFKRVVTDGNQPLDNELKFVSQLMLWTEKGASRMCKILDTDMAWTRFDELEETYFKIKEDVQALNISELSPELQMFKKIFDTVAQQQLENKKLKQELKKDISETKEEIQGIRDVVAINSADWKTDCKNLITKIAYQLGGIKHIQDVYKEVYSTLDRRLGVSLSTRLTNKRRRMADEGVCKSKRDKLNYVDVITDDKKLIEGYVAIVKELSIKYGVA